MRRFPRNTSRRGFSFLELQVSLILLGIALAGLVPLVAIQSRQLKALEYQWDPDWTAAEAEEDYWIDPHRATSDGPVYDLVPADVRDCSQANPWASKLGASARLVPRESTASPVSSVAGGWVTGTTVNTVTVSAGTVSTSGASASATVEVTPIAAEP